MQRFSMSVGLNKIMRVSFVLPLQDTCVLSYESESLLSVFLISLVDTGMISVPFSECDDPLVSELICLFLSSASSRLLFPETEDPEHLNS